MPFVLSDIIKHILIQTNKSKECNIKLLTNSIDTELEQLKNTNNYRVDSAENAYSGGMLSGPYNRKSQLQDKIAVKNPIIALRNSNKITINNEVSYFRGIFNIYNIKLKNTDDKIHFIAFESPLMRKKKGGSSRKISLDLLGVMNKDIICIEGKVRQSGSTNIQYALLEAFAYFYCIHWVLNDETLKKPLINEITSCVSRNIKSENNETYDNVKFLVAAPSNYYKNITKYDINITRLIENSICNKYNNNFMGYLELPYIELVKGGTNIENLSIPKFTDIGKESTIHPSGWDFSQLN